MTTAKFLEGFSGKLAERWVGALFTPAFIFWLGGGIVAIQRFGWVAFADFFGDLDDPLPAAITIFALLVVAVSGFVAQNFDFTTLQLLEGYWPGWCRPLSQRGLRRQKQRFRLLDSRYQAFNQKGISTLTPEEREIYIRMDLELSQFPSFGRFLPTKLGNILRAAEDRCLEKYGLDAIICWPRLWLLLPDSVRAEISEARNNLNLMARLWLWSLMFLLWTPIFWIGLPIEMRAVLMWVAQGWPIMLGSCSMVLTYRWTIQVALVYGDLLESAFDLYRFYLYRALHWPLPSNPNEERSLGYKLTDFLWHGSTQKFPEFEASKNR